MHDTYRSVSSFSSKCHVSSSSTYTIATVWTFVISTWTNKKHGLQYAVSNKPQKTAKKQKFSQGINEPFSVKTES